MVGMEKVRKIFKSYFIIFYMDERLNNLSFELSNYQKDFLILQDKMSELKRKFPNQFVAIKEGEIISSGSSVEEVSEQLNKRGIEPSGTVVEFVPGNEQVMVL